MKADGTLTVPSSSRPKLSPNPRQPTSRLDVDSPDVATGEVPWDGVT